MTRMKRSKDSDTFQRKSLLPLCLNYRPSTKMEIGVFTIILESINLMMITIVTIITITIIDCK